MIDRGGGPSYPSDPDKALQMTGQSVYVPGVNWNVPTQQEYYEKGKTSDYFWGIDSSQSKSDSLPTYISDLLSGVIAYASQSTEAANQLQLQMMRESNAFSRAEAEKTRAYNSAEALKAFERSEASRLSAQEYNTRERLAAQEYNTSERLAAQAFNQYNADTQYQRAVADLYSAGLNPLLAVGAQNSAASVGAARVSGASSSGSGSSAASASSARGNSASAHKNGVESLISSVLGYLSDKERNSILRDQNELNFVGKIFGSLFGLL